MTVSRMSTRVSGLLYAAISDVPGEITLTEAMREAQEEKERIDLKLALNTVDKMEVDGNGYVITKK